MYTEKKQQLTVQYSIIFKTVSCTVDLGLFACCAVTVFISIQFSFIYQVPNLNNSDPQGALGCKVKTLQ